ncbi:MAG: GNAT family N-acetyltransferase [Spirochaetia bacterium]|jgi:predicted GNAT family acetyltransferase|nr:GNAT family N-acetyltransferase [Spirochaetia bacterium]
MHTIKQGEKGFYIGDGAAPLADIEISRKEDLTIIIEHTRVSESLKGQGIGGRLVEAVVKLARKEGVKIHPLCSYAAAYLKKKPEYLDLLA